MSKVGKQIIEGLEEALANARGKDVPGLVIHHIDVGTVDAKSVRKKLHLTQEQMAAFLGTSTSGYRKWEQGDRLPSGAARTLLKVMEKEPEAVLRALTDA